MEEKKDLLKHQYFLQNGHFHILCNKKGYNTFLQIR